MRRSWKLLAKCREILGNDRNIREDIKKIWRKVEV